MSLDTDRPLVSEPVEYSVRESARACRVRLVMRASGLEVVVPRGYRRNRIPKLLEQRRAWIDSSWLHLQGERRRLTADPPRLPTNISLPAIGEEWGVEYRPPRSAGDVVGGSSHVTARDVRGRRLVVTGESRDFRACRAALCRWLGRRGREELVPRLEKLARRHGFEYQKVQVRQQRTRWGSCSRRGTISLNARLLLLPSQAVDYVLLHELCHTVHPNHSPSFWALVEHCDPECLLHKRLVRDCARALPTWLEYEPRGDLM